VREEGRYRVVRRGSADKLFAGFLIACMVLGCSVLALFPRFLTMLVMVLSPYIGAALVLMTLVWLDRRKLL
jgi:hypothetical protein